MVEFPRKVSLFERLSESELKEIAVLFQLREFPPNSEVVHEGQPSDAFYIIRSGSVRITRGRSSSYITQLEEGEYFGEAALFHDLKRTATVCTNERTQLVVAEKGAFLGFLERNSPIANKILFQFLRQLIHRLDKTSARLEIKDKNLLNQSEIDQLLTWYL